MKTILCYGDSNTWGYNAENGKRFPRNERWTGILMQQLGPEYYVIEEGLCGRTTVWDDPVEGDIANGRKYLKPCLESHAPIDLAILMLGTNDLKIKYSATAYDIATGVRVLIRMVLGSFTGMEGKPPKVLLVSPITIGNIVKSELAEVYGAGVNEKSKALAEYYERFAGQNGCEYLDAAQITEAGTIDAVHLDAQGHKKLGLAMADKVKAVLIN